MYITTTQSHNFEAGDMIEIDTLDCRKWKRFLHWITFRSPPTKKERMRITGVTSTTFTDAAPNAEITGRTLAQNEADGA